MRYYKLGETPAYYITAWYNLLSGKWEFGKVHATETTVEGVTVELTTNGRHANYEMKLSGFDLDTSANKVYGVVLTTADGSEYGLHHVTNIWRGTELGFNTDETYLASISACAARYSSRSASCSARNFRLYFVALYCSKTGRVLAY